MSSGNNKKGTKALHDSIANRIIRFLIIKMSNRILPLGNQNVDDAPDTV